MVKCVTFEITLHGFMFLQKKQSDYEGASFISSADLSCKTIYSSMQSSQILYTVVLQQEIICYAVSKTFIQLNWFQHLLRKCHSCCMTLCSRSDKSSRTHRWAVQRYITFIGYHPYCRKEEALHLHAIRCLVLICSQRKSVHSAQLQLFLMLCFQSYSSP